MVCLSKRRARCYLAALADSSPVSARLVVAADTAPDAVERARRLLPEGVAVVADHRDLLGHGIDAVVLTTPDDTHEELACFFLEAGVPVYLETVSYTHLTLPTSDLV